MPDLIRYQLQFRRQPDALIDRPLGIQTRRPFGAADQVNGYFAFAKGIIKILQGFLSRADDHVIHFKQSLFVIDRDMQALIIDPAIGNARDHLNAPAVQRQSQDPTGRLAQAFADLAITALQ